jgi:hypothetical protein
MSVGESEVIHRNRSPSSERTAGAAVGRRHSPAVETDSISVRIVCLTCAGRLGQQSMIDCRSGAIGPRKFEEITESAAHFAALRDSETRCCRKPFDSTGCGRGFESLRVYYSISPNREMA